MKMKLPMRLLYLTALLTAFCLINTTSWANGSVPVTGSASFSSAQSWYFDFTGAGVGGSITAFSTTPDAFDELFCGPGPVCTVNVPTAADLGGFCPNIISGGTLNNVTANWLDGGLGFIFTRPVLPDGYFGVTVPARIGGGVGGFSSNADCATPSNSMRVWDVGVTGKGTANLFGLAEGGNLFLLEADMNFDGTATSPNFTPEPSSLVLIGSGVLGLAGVLRRKLML